MAANLTQQYRKAEQAYRRAVSPQEELACLQQMLVELPKHKGTDRIHADLKQKISRLRKQISAPILKTGSKGLTTIPRQGAGRAVIIGAPNCGKSQLLATLTDARPIVAEYPFSTLQPIPGMMPWQDIRVQLIDTPPTTPDGIDPETLSLVRGADLALLMLDLGCDDGGQQLIEILNLFNDTKSRLGRVTKIDAENIGVTVTQTFILANKIDLDQAVDRARLNESSVDADFDRFVISAKERLGLAELIEAIYLALNVIRVYTKMPGRKEPDMESPFTLPRGHTLQDLALQVHRDLARNLKGGKVWGSQVHAATPVKPEYVLNDLDIVELHA